MDPTKFRNLVRETTKRDITSDQAKNFLEIFQDDLTAVETAARRAFIEKHFGVKKTNS